MRGARGARSLSVQVAKRRVPLAALRRRAGRSLSSIAFDECTAVVNGNKAVELEQRRVGVLRRDDEGDGAPPRSSIDLARGTAFIVVPRKAVGEAVDPCADRHDDQRSPQAATPSTPAASPCSSSSSSSASPAHLAAGCHFSDVRPCVDLVTFLKPQSRDVISRGPAEVARWGEARGGPTRCCFTPPTVGRLGRLKRTARTVLAGAVRPPGLVHVAHATGPEVPASGPGGRVGRRRRPPRPAAPCLPGRRARCGRRPVPRSGSHRRRTRRFRTPR